MVNKTYLYENDEKLKEIISKDFDDLSNIFLIQIINITENNKQQINNIISTLKLIFPNSNIIENKLPENEKIKLKDSILISITQLNKYGEKNAAKIDFLDAYINLIEKLDSSIFMADNNQKIIYGNKNFCSLIGKQINEIKGQNSLILFDISTQKTIKEHIEKFRKNGKTSTYYGNIINYNGESIPVRITGMPFHGDINVVVLNDLREIEDLKIKNKELEKSRARYRGVVEDQTELICRFDTNGTINFKNLAFHRYFKQKGNKLQGENFFKIIPGIENTQINSITKEISIFSPVKSFQHKFKQTNGEMHRLEWTIRGIFNTNKELIEFQTVGRDITEMIFMEKKMEKNKNEYFQIYTTIVDNMNEAIWIGDNNNNTIYANPRFREITGYKIDEIKGKKLTDYYDYNTILQINNINKQFIENKKYKGEGAIVNKNMEIIPVLINQIPFVDGGVVQIMSDISELKKIRERADALEEMNKIKNEFVSIVSHELRTPMTSIKGYLSMILDGDYGDLEPNIENVIKIVLKSTERQIELINDMLDLNKLESDKYEFQNEEFYVQEAFNTIKDEYEGIAKEKKIELIIENKDKNIKLNTDKNKFKQVLINLLGNSLKFTPSGGKISIIATPKDLNYLLVEVIDTGIGIAPKDHKKVFEKFSQVHSHLNRQRQGTGLGIPISSKIIDEMGGKLKLKSELGKGSNFYFSIPYLINNDLLFN